MHRRKERLSRPERYYKRRKSFYAVTAFVISSEFFKRLSEPEHITAEKSEQHTVLFKKKTDILQFLRLADVLERVVHGYDLAAVEAHGAQSVTQLGNISQALSVYHFIAELMNEVPLIVIPARSFYLHGVRM